MEPQSRTLQVLLAIGAILGVVGIVAARFMISGLPGIPKPEGFQQAGVPVIQKTSQKPPSFIMPPPPPPTVVNAEITPIPDSPADTTTSSTPSSTPQQEESSMEIN